MKINESGTFRLSNYILDLNALEIEVSSELQVTIVDDITVDVTIDVKKNSKVDFRLRTHNPSEKSLIFKLLEKGASINIKCIYDIFDTCKLKTIQHHLAPDTESNLEIKSVLHETAKLFSNNLIRIERSAQCSKAMERNKNLILGKSARVVTIPRLEVEANDVSVQHGAAISKIDQDQLFYLQSRGIGIEAAKQLLIKAFLS